MPWRGRAAHGPGPATAGVPEGIDGLHEISRSSDTVVLRGLRHGDSLPVLVKTPSASVPDGPELARYRREFRLLQDLQGEGIPRPVELQEFGGRIDLGRRRRTLGRLHPRLRHGSELRHQLGGDLGRRQRCGDRVEQQHQLRDAAPEDLSGTGAAPSREQLPPTGVQQSGQPGEFRQLCRGRACGQLFELCQHGRQPRRRQPVGAGVIEPFRGRQQLAEAAGHEGPQPLARAAARQPGADSFQIRRHVAQVRRCRGADGCATGGRQPGQHIPQRGPWHQAALAVDGEQFLEAAQRARQARIAAARTAADQGMDGSRQHFHVRATPSRGAVAESLQDLDLGQCFVAQLRRAELRFDRGSAIGADRNGLRGRARPRRGKRFRYRRHHGGRYRRGQGQ